MDKNLVQKAKNKEYIDFTDHAKEILKQKLLKNEKFQDYLHKFSKIYNIKVED